MERKNEKNLQSYNNPCIDSQSVKILNTVAIFDLHFFVKTFFNCLRQVQNETNLSPKYIYITLTSRA